MLFFLFYSRSSKQRKCALMHAYPLLSDIVISFASHLVIETSQEISDVPYADYFTVEVGGNLHRMLSVVCWEMCVIGEKVTFG